MSSVTNRSTTHLPTILLVDDIPSNLELLVSYLDSDYRVPTARDGKKALQRALLLKPDLILLDIQMPEMDGFETCQKLKEYEETRDIPVIFMSALADTTDKVKGFEVGAVDYITKPVDCAELIARINTHLTLHSMREELRQKNKILERNAMQQKRVEQILRHDLKSPLQAIMSIPDLISFEGDLSEEQKNLLDLVDEAGHQILNMINNSLSIYKMEHGAYHPKLVKVDLIKALQKVIHSRKVHEKLRPMLLSKSGVLIKQGEELFISGEEDLLYAIFSNLLKNASEASPENESILINIEEGEDISISINNKGSVPVEIRDTFFEEFSTAGKEFGTGLGTYSAKLMTEALKGTIALDCTIEGETTLLLTFPSYCNK